MSSTTTIQRFSHRLQRCAGAGGGGGCWVVAIGGAAVLHLRFAAMITLHPHSAAPRAAPQELAVAADAAESASAAWQCRICLGADVDAAMKECGHTLCRACAAASAPGRCPFCRKPSGVLRLFNG